jgi:hypothetical protein
MANIHASNNRATISAPLSQSQDGSQRSPVVSFSDLHQVFQKLHQPRHHHGENFQLEPGAARSLFTIVHFPFAPDPCHRSRSRPDLRGSDPAGPNRSQAPRRIRIHRGPSAFGEVQTGHLPLDLASLPRGGKPGADGQGGRPGPREAAPCGVREDHRIAFGWIHPQNQTQAERQCGARAPENMNHAPFGDAAGDDVSSLLAAMISSNSLVDDQGGSCPAFLAVRRSGVVQITAGCVLTPRNYFMMQSVAGTPGLFVGPGHGALGSASTELPQRNLNNGCRIKARPFLARAGNGSVSLSLCVPQLPDPRQPVSLPKFQIQEITRTAGDV